MQQISDWLNQLGMSEYAERFADNKIDISVLPHLTDQDLKDIDVPLGHRRKMLAAIAELGVANQQKPEPAGSVEPKLQEAAERRQVTVMFSDLVGSTALSARLDPEDLREVITVYRKCVAQRVHRFDGYVARYLGDGVLVYFGYPQAHEDDAERAVRAGLQLITAVGGIKTHASLQTRIGIATGLVVVGDLIGSGGAHDIVGETPNLAARLQEIADPNTVVIAERTRRLLGTLFELKDLGHWELKGIPRMAQAWAALRPSSVKSRFEALHGTGLTTLVGREEEAELLLRHWSMARGGAGQVVLMSGEAGIGKSRLTAALQERLAPEPRIHLRYFCSAHHTDSAFYPIIDQMERAAAIGHDDSSKAKLNKLDALLAQTSTSIEDAALFAELLSLPNDGRYPALDLAPAERRQRTLEALILQIRVLGRSSPVLMIIEDVHWIDPSSLELLGHIVDSIVTFPVLLIGTLRPEFEPPWIGPPHVTAVAINRLTHREVGIMIDRVAGDRLLQPSIRQDIIERTDGIPLFIEEMTKAVLEAEGADAVQHIAAVVPPSAIAIPASLHASLSARLDRLGPAKEVAQIGAAIGREFSHALVASIVRQSDAELESALDRLVAAGLLFRQGGPPNAAYLFKHALVQDAAYSALLREPRRALHTRIAETLESKFTEVADSRPEVLARHYTEAGLIEKAVILWGKAGQQSLKRSALVEAIEQFSRALRQMATLPAACALRQEQIKLQVALIGPLIHVKGPGAPETKAAVDRARQLIEQAEAMGEPLEDSLLLFSVLYGSWAVNYAAFKGNAMRELARQFLAFADKENAKAPLTVGHRLMFISLAMTGSLAESQTHCDQVLALYHPVEQRPLATRFGHDNRVAVLSYRSCVSWVLGYPVAALVDADRALGDARAIAQASTLMFALSVTSLSHIFSGKYARAKAQTDELITLAGEKSAFWNANRMLIQGWLLALRGEATEAVHMLTSGITSWRLTGSQLWMPMWLAYLGKAYAELGALEDASLSINEALNAIEITSERWCEAEVNRIAGEIALWSSEPDATKAEAFFDRALAVARQQRAKSWELRAAMSMGRLWRDQGKRKQAHALLAPVYGWFTEGFDTLDLKEAKALLDALSS
jgi:class 3 adenylate cyclase/predicted ATPase